MADRRLEQRVRKLARRPLVPSREAERLIADLPVPTKWRGETRRDVGAARCVRLIASPEARCCDTILALVPVLLSGRPVVGATISGIETAKVDEIRTLDEVGRMHLANDQLRRLLTSPPLCNRPQIGVILSTNRPALLSQALSYLRAQAMVDVVLRIAVHGADPPPDLGELTGGAVIDAKLSTFDAGTSFGEVLQHLTSQLDTEFFSKWDDDDLYGPYHLIDLWIAAKLSGRSLVGKAAEFVHIAERQIVVRRRGGEIHTDSRFLAGGALLVDRDVFDLVGGWAPLPRGVDQNLIERFERHGYPAFRAHGLGFVLTRHDQGHTWDVDDTYFLSGAAEAWGSSGLAYAGVADSQPKPTPDRPGAKTSITLCVPNKDNRAAMVRLEHAWANDGPFESVIVADDRSNPPLSFGAASGRLRVSRVPALNGFGAGRARHHIAQEVTSEIVVFADSDIHISEEAATFIAGMHAEEPTALHASLNFSSIDSDTAVEILKSEGMRALEELLSEEGIPGQLWREPHWARSSDLAHPRSSSFRACVGGFVSVDLPVYVQSGGFRDVPTRGVEDVEFGYRLMITGCRQLLYRGPGITHLGQRTFAKGLSGPEDAARERALARWIPIWSRGLTERATALAGDDADPVPLIAIPDSADICRIANELLGSGTAIEAFSDWSVLNAPFGIADRPLPESAVGVLEKVMRAFRDGPCGEVMILGNGDVVARITALWALNRQRVLAGTIPILDQHSLEDAWADLDQTRVAVENAVGITFVSI